jgi:hypothetical protein
LSERISCSVSEYSKAASEWPDDPTLEQLQERWLDFLTTIRLDLGERRFAFLKETTPTAFAFGVLTVGAASEFISKTLEQDAAAAPLLAEGIKRHLGVITEVEFDVPPTRRTRPEPPPEPPPRKGRDTPEEHAAKELAKRLLWLRVDVRAKSLLAEEQSVAKVEQLRDKALPWIPSDEFLATVEPMEHRIDPLMMVGGRLLFSGPAKAGKSTLTLSLCNSLLTGKPFLDRFPVKPIEGSLVYVNLEMPDPLLGEWIDWHIEESVRPRFRLWNAIAQAALLDTRYDAGLEFLAQRVMETECGILVIDPITMAYSALGINANSNDEVAPWLNGLNVLKERTGGKLEIILIHHFGHGMDRGRGASVQLGWPDHLWDYMVSMDRRFLRTKGRSGFMDPSEVLFDPIYGRVWMEDEPSTSGTSKTPAELLAEIRVALEDSIDGLTATEVIRHIPGRDSDVRAMLREAVAKGWITMTREDRTKVYRWVG